MGNASVRNPQIFHTSHTPSHTPSPTPTRMVEIRATIQLLQTDHQKQKQTQKDKDQLSYLLKETPCGANFHIDSGNLSKSFLPAAYSIEQILARTPLTRDCKVKFSTKQAEIYDRLYSLTPEWSRERCIQAPRISKFVLYKFLRTDVHLLEDVCLLILEYHN